MFVFNIKNYLPRFLLNDQTGYAMAKAIEAGVQYLNDRLYEAINISRDIDKMPSWKLDELAWELNCIYDSDADIETRRKWIKNAFEYYKMHGTAKGIEQYLSEYFNGVEVIESEETPFHFSVIIDGEFDKKEQAWARKAVEKTKNVRSVLDTLHQGINFAVEVAAEVEVSEYDDVLYAGSDVYAGVYPEIAEV